MVDLLLIHPPYHRRLGSGVIYPLGLGYIAAAAMKAEFNVKIIDGALLCSSLHRKSLEHFLSRLSRELLLSPPQLAIGIGPCTTSSVSSIKAISGVCKEMCPQIPLVYGGPLASVPGQEKLFFEEFSASAIVPGDGEFAICELLVALQQNQPIDAIDHVITQVSPSKKCSIISNLDSLPFPYRETKGYRLSTRRELFFPTFATLITSRGCPNTCSFCMSGILREGSYHRRSIANVIEEVIHLQTYYNVRSIVFYDDMFFPSADSLTEDVRLLVRSFAKLEKPIYWEIEIAPDVLLAMEPVIIIQLFNLGCRQINIGIEKGGNDTLGFACKKIDSDMIKRSIQRIKEAVPLMRLTGTFIFGGPGETKDSINDTLMFAMSLGLLFAHFYPLAVYPGTKLFKLTYPDANPLWWYERIMNDNLPWGEIIYEGGDISRDDLLMYVAEAYKHFYQNPNWHKLAKLQLGKQYINTLSVVDAWQRDRFTLGDMS